MRPIVYTITGGGGTQIVLPGGPLDYYIFPANIGLERSGHGVYYLYGAIYV